MSRLARFTLLTALVTFLLVSVGGLVRATDSGLGCGDDWPRCYGHWLPPTSSFDVTLAPDEVPDLAKTDAEVVEVLDDGSVVMRADAAETWIEYTHRLLGTVAGLLTIGVAIGAWRRRRGDPRTWRIGRLLVPLIIAQGLLGAYVVNRELEAWTVVAHLGMAMAFFGLLLALVVHLLVAPAREPVDGRAVRFAATGAVAVFGLNLLGSYITGRDAGLAFTDWPLMNGQVVPDAVDHLRPGLHFSHRALAALVGLFLVWAVVELRRTGLRRLRTAGLVVAALFAVQIGVGAANVFSLLHSASVTAHLALSVAIWGALVVTWALALRTPAARVATGDTRTLGLGARLLRGRARSKANGRTRSKVAAYVALTKPRIIELLLVTTVPTMVIAEGGWPSTWLVVATVVGGTLAAGGANAINMVVDRDIDRLMDRTKGRPLVTGEIADHRYALAFALALEVAAFAWLWGLVNLLSAALAISATLFYVFVYTLWLKRTSTNNIVIGGAAGAVPVLVGWSAVTGSLGLAPVVLFAIIFYWTPPHFWALAIRYRDDYQAAHVPMLPAVASLRVTARKVLLYTLVLWGLTLVLHPVAGMGEIYLAAAVVLGGVFTYHAAQLFRASADGPVPVSVSAGAGSGAALDAPQRAMRLFAWSITYLTLLFGAMAADQLVLAT